METRLAEIERLMQDTTLSHSDQQLLDQELDELLRQMDEFRAMGDFEEPPECDCADCVAIAANPDPNEWVDDRVDCGNCAGCAYCMSFDGYDGADEV